MTEPTHTPGPWAAKFYAPGDCYIITYGGGDNWLADVWTDGEPVKATADAHLIASAPDLLAALQWAVETADTEQYEADWYAAARVAITKAKGQ